jgi:hypothetical protein
MRTSSRCRHAAAALLMAISLTAATPALASGLASAASQGLTYYATYSSYASCEAAANANARGRSWQCVESARGFDLYFS